MNLQRETLLPRNLKHQFDQPNLDHILQDQDMNRVLNQEIQEALQVLEMTALYIPQKDQFQKKEVTRTM